MRGKKSTVLCLIGLTFFFFSLGGEAQEEKAGMVEGRKPGAEVKKTGGETKKPETKKARAKPKQSGGEPRKSEGESPGSLAEAMKPSQEAKEASAEAKPPGAGAKIPRQEQRKSSVDTKKSETGGGLGGLGLTSSRAPVDIVSDTVEANNRQSIVVFKGNVVAKQEEVTVYTSVLTVYYDSQTKKVKEIVATGNVRIVQLDKRATSQKAIFYESENKVVLDGDVVLREGDNVVRGERVTYYSDEDKTIVEGGKGGGRVSTRITPSQKDEKDEMGKQQAKEKGEEQPAGSK